MSSVHTQQHSAWLAHAHNTVRALRSRPLEAIWAAAALALCLCGTTSCAKRLDPNDPLRPGAHACALVFVRTDCPISNRYAPELQRIADAFEARGARITLVYPDPDEDEAAIAKHRREFGLKLPWARDPEHALVQRAGATVTPEAAVFAANGERVYLGRIDDLYPDFGKVRHKPTTRDLREALTAALSGTTVAAPTTKAVGCPIPALEAP